ncbi:universal stress protein, partial [Chloroflexota bacterium]
AELAIQQARREDIKNLLHARRYLRRKAREITAKGVKCTHHTFVGRPAESIRGFCNEENVDLVVMTTHGRSGIKRAIIGSITDRLIRETGMPVLVIRPHKRCRK